MKLKNLKYITQKQICLIILLIIFVELQVISSSKNVINYNKKIQLECKVLSCMVKVIPKPIQSLTDTIHSLPYGNIVWGIYGAESGFGKHDSCRSKGLFNGFGYGLPSCYSSPTEIASIVSNWLYRHIQVKGLTLQQSLCLYQSGFIQDNCPYVSKVLWFK